MLSYLKRAYLAIWRTGGETGHPERPLWIDDEGWLHGFGVVRYPSIRSYELTSDGPIGIVWHYTATNVGTAKSLAKRIRKYRRGKDRAASWHVVIAEDGTIYQSVPFERGAWHCGRGRIDGHRVNKCTAGIEMEGQGTVFSSPQKSAAARLTQALVDKYDITRARCGLDHSQFDPKRRADAGPYWSKIRERFLREIFAGQSENAD